MMNYPGGPFYIKFGETHFMNYHENPFSIMFAEPHNDGPSSELFLH